MDFSVFDTSGLHLEIKERRYLSNFLLISVMSNILQYWVGTIQGWASQAISRVESSLSLFLKLSSQVESSRERNQVESSRVES